jgi:hypothetical protein
MYVLVWTEKSNKVLPNEWKKEEMKCIRKLVDISVLGNNISIKFTFRPLTDAFPFFCLRFVLADKQAKLDKKKAKQDVAQPCTTTPPSWTCTTASPCSACATEPRKVSSCFLTFCQS